MIRQIARSPLGQVVPTVRRGILEAHREMWPRAYVAKELFDVIEAQTAAD